MFLRSGIRAAQSLRLRSSSHKFINSMPLRSKVYWPAGSAAASMTSFAGAVPPKIDSLPTDSEGDVLFSSKYGLRTIELNRPEKLNALNGSMARKIVPRLQEWDKSQLANIIVIKGAGRAFCAGGDVWTLAELNQHGEEGIQKSIEYFALEYRLDHLIAMYNKPYVAFLDGITMGGGVGLSIHAPFRIATENTRFGMPETRIGFFPDVGGSFFLSRMEGEIGTYLALTSNELRGVATLYAGVATHFIHSSILPDLEERLAELHFEDFATYDQRLRLVDAAIREFATGLPEQPEKTVIQGEIRKAIDRCFRFDSIPAILDALEREKTEWADKTKKTILDRSPTSLVVTLRQLREGKKWSINETFQREFVLASRFMHHKDFVEGVVKRLSKEPSQPNWDPAEIPKTSAGIQAITEEFFKTPVGAEKLKLLISGADYHEYQYPSLGLPKEKEIKALIENGGFTSPKAVVDHFIEERQLKDGMREKVYDVIERMVSANEDGMLYWDEKKAISK